MKKSLSVVFCVSILFPAVVSGEEKAPGTVKELWADFDPRKDALDAKLVREWEKDGIVYRYVTYHIGTFKGKPARMAAFLRISQRRRRNCPACCIFTAADSEPSSTKSSSMPSEGYACLSINWGGREMENAKDRRPEHRLGMPSIRRRRTCRATSTSSPATSTSIRSSRPATTTGTLLTLGARRGLTFLEQQPEVDADRLGVYGHSMGGNLTVYVAGTDNRVKAAAPSVGGSGFRTEPWPLLPQEKTADAERRRETVQCDHRLRVLCSAHQGSAALAGSDQRLPRDHGRHLSHRRVDPAQERPVRLHART